MIAAVEGKENRFISQYGNATVGKKTSVTPAKAAVVAPVVSVQKESSIKAQATKKAEFSCEPKKTCGQMSSCAEAKFQLKNCGNHSIDGDGDGKPCASICK